MIPFKKFPSVISRKDTQKIEYFLDNYPDFTEEGNKYIIHEEIEGDPFAVLMSGREGEFGFSNGSKILSMEDEYRGFLEMMSSRMGEYLLKNLASWSQIQTADIELYGVIPTAGKYAPEDHLSGFYITDVLIDGQLASPVYAGQGLVSNGLASFYAPTVYICQDINEALAYDKAGDKDSLLKVEGFPTPKMYGTRIKPYNFQKLSDKKEPFFIVEKFDRGEE